MGPSVGGGEVSAGAGSLLWLTAKPCRERPGGLQDLAGSWYKQRGFLGRAAVCELPAQPLGGEEVEHDGGGFRG